MRRGSYYDVLRGTTKLNESALRGRAELDAFLKAESIEVPS